MHREHDTPPPCADLEARRANLPSPVSNDTIVVELRATGISMGAAAIIFPEAARRNGEEGHCFAINQTASAIRSHYAVLQRRRRKSDNHAESFVIY